MKTNVHAFIHVQCISILLITQELVQRNWLDETLTSGNYNSKWRDREAQLQWEITANINTVNQHLFLKRFKYIFRAHVETDSHDRWGCGCCGQFTAVHGPCSTVINGRRNLTLWVRKYFKVVAVNLYWTNYFALSNKNTSASHMWTIRAT